MNKQIRNEINGMLIDINKVIEKLEFQVYQMQKDGLAKAIRQQLLDIASYNIDFTSQTKQLKSAKCFYIKDNDFDLLTTNTSQVLGIDKNKLTFTMIKNAIVSACKIKMMLEIKNKTKKVK